MSTDVRSIVAQRLDTETAERFASAARAGTYVGTFDDFRESCFGKDLNVWLDRTTAEIERVASVLYPDGAVRDAIVAEVAARIPLHPMWMDNHADLWTRWPIQVPVAEVAMRLGASDDEQARLISLVLMRGGFLVVGGDSEVQNVAGFRTVTGTAEPSSVHAVPQGWFLNYGHFADDKDLPQHPFWRIAQAMESPARGQWLTSRLVENDSPTREAVTDADGEIDVNAFYRLHSQVIGALAVWDPFLVAQFVAVERLSHLACAREAARLLRAEYAEDLDTQVRTVLEKERTVSDANDDEARRQLVAATRSALEDLRAALGLDEADPTTEAEAGAVVDDMLSWDAKLAAFLEKFGEQGKVGAESVRKRAREQLQQFRADAVRPLRFRTARAADVWVLWLGADRRVVRNVARAVWHARVLPRLESLFRRAHAALVHPVMVEVTELYSRAWKPEERNGQRTLQLPTAGIVVVPTLGDETLDALLEQGLAWLSSVTGHRLLRWEVVEGHRRYLTTGDRVLRVEGGWSGLAEAIGASTKKDADKLRSLVLAQAHCRFQLPDGTAGNLLSYREPTEHGGRGRTRTVEITLGTPLLPGYVDALPGSKSVSAREARRLVPMLADLPPFVGQRNGHGAQASLALAVVTELRTQAAELVKEGGVVVPFDRLGRRFGVKPSLLPEMRDRWTRDGDDGPAFLKSVDKAGRVTLGDEHKPARDFLEDAGRREIDGQHAGQKSADRRRAAQRRHGKSE